MPYESSHTLGDEITPDVVKEEFKDSDPHWSLYETPYPQKRKQKYCCCFTSRGLCMSVCVTFWLVFIAVLGVAAFLLFPRIPKITIGSPYLPIDTRGPQFNSTGGKLDTVQYRVNINFTVDSSNYIDIFCSEIAVNGNLKTADDKEISNAFAIGGVQNALFPAFKKVTYSMVFLIDVAY
jgi:hypothetical protein